MPQAYDEFVAGAMADAGNDDGARRGEVGSHHCYLLLSLLSITNPSCKT